MPHPHSYSSMAKVAGLPVRCWLLIALLIHAPGAYSQTIIPSSAVAPSTVNQMDIHDETATTYSASSPLNWVRTYTPQAPLTDATRVVAAKGYPEVGLATQYLDGLGRPLQTVSRAAAPPSQSAPSGKDLVAPVVYDEFGRETYHYLPYAASGSVDGSFRTAPFSEQKTFMQAQYPGEQVYYGQTEYEASPLNRVKKTMAAGNSWAGIGKGVEMRYEVNTEENEVMLWSISTANQATPSRTGYYDGPKGDNGAQLYRTVTEDENGGRVAEYKDKEGQVVLKKVAINRTADITSHEGWFEMYREIRTVK